MRVNLKNSFFIFILLNVSFYGFVMAKSGKVCNDRGFVSSIASAKSNHLTELDIRDKYAFIAAYSYQRMGKSSEYCGVSFSNILFLLRQATEDIDYKNEQSESIRLRTSDFVANTMSSIFRSGNSAAGKDVELADCWKYSNGNLIACEVLEAKKYCRVESGVAPMGFKSLRKFSGSQFICKE